MGIGFDPRSLTVVDTISAIPWSGTLSCFTICLRPPTSELSENYVKLEKLTEKNIEALRANPRVTVSSYDELSLRDEEGHLIGGRSATLKIADNLAKIAAHKHVIVDISGLPRTVFYPLIKFLCKKSDDGIIENLHIAVTEDSDLDRRIKSGEFGNPDYLFSFRPDVPDGLKLIWLPAISSGESSRLEKIHNQIERDCAEICPILPFPARDLRRADEIIMRLRSILFERMLVSENNLLLCDEESPFDIYRKILDVDDYYRETLSRLDGLSEIRTVVSPMASKMLSLGMLLASIERNLAVSYTEAGSYEIEGDFSDFEGNLSPVEIWLTGEAYS